MQLGIHIGTFERPTLEAALDAVVEHGLHCVHLNLAAAGLPSMPGQIEDSLCRRISRQLVARGISVATLSGTFNMIHPEVEQRGLGLRRLEVIASSARRLGTSVVSLCTGTRDPDDMWRRHADNDGPAAWDDLVAIMSEALAIARSHDVTLAVEPEVSNVVDSAVKARRLLDRMGSSRLKVIIDPANLFPAGQLPRMRAILDEAFELLGREIVLAHAKDLDRDGHAGQIPAGQGRLDYGHYLGLLQKWGFDGPLILHGLSESDVAGCVGFLRGKIPE